MKITVFGASGMVGKYVVKYALALGHHVTAFGRHVENLIDADIQNDKLVAYKGSVFNRDEIKEAIKNTDVVISVLGGAVSENDKTRSLGIKNIVAEMEKAGIMRIVSLGGLGVLDDENGDYLLNSKYYPPEYFAVGQEHLKAYEFLKQSVLKWTFVCPPQIRDKDATGEYTISENMPPKSEIQQVNAGDIAIFMVNESLSNEHVYKRVGIVTTSLQ